MVQLSESFTTRVVPFVAVAVAAAALVAAPVQAASPASDDGTPFIGTGDSEPPPEPKPTAQDGGKQHGAGRGGAKVRTTWRLSNEWTLSRWAYVDRDVTARRSPSTRSHGLRRLRTYTADGTPELVLTLKRKMTGDGRFWVLVRLPMRPSNTTGWVPRSALGGYHVVRTYLKINRGRFQATLFRSGRRIWSARIGVGKRKWPTPRGRFYVRERLVPSDKKGIYGVFAFGTSAYSPVLTDWPGGGVVGIHGTNEPNLIPGRISHGCIRVRNSRISRLRRLMPLGTPIRIV
jgi:L,D-transpeptidase-like protein